MNETPDSFYPFAMAWKIGEPPRYFGTKDGWAKNAPLLKFERIDPGIL